MNTTELPKELNPSTLLAYFYNALGACGCSELAAMHASLIRLLEWHALEDRMSYAELYPEPGVFYLLAGLLTDLKLTEHGSSIRFPWLTDDGKRLLDALKQYSAEAIENADQE